MNANKIYSSWKAYDQSPNIEHVIYFTISEKPRELELASLILKATGKTLDITSELTRALVEKIPLVWNDSVVEVVHIDKNTLDKHVELRVFLESMASYKPYTRTSGEKKSDTDVDELTAQMADMTMATSADTLMADKSKPRVHSLAHKTNSLVSMDWVRACASRLVAEAPLYEDQVLDRDSFVLIHRDTSDRHVHHVNSSIVDFVKELRQERKDAKGRQLTITWQFSYDVFRAPIKHAIHLQKFKSALTELCPNHWFEFLIFVCSIGIPIHGLMKSNEILKYWKKYSVLSQENIVKILLRPRFETSVSDIEINELVRLYRENHSDFSRHLAPKSVGPLDQYIEQYFFQAFYAYPSPDEIEHLWKHIQTNALEWSD